ncbi:MAG: glycosyltransferase family 39 protein [Pirellulaceae bacterium]
MTTKCSTPDVLERADLICPALIACAYLALVGATLDWHGYWSDEFHTIHAVELSWSELIAERASRGHPPLFFLLEKMWIALAGSGETAYRSLPMIFGLGSVLLTYVIARRETDRRTACFASLLLVATATQLMICQLARSYTLLQMLVTCQAALILSKRPPTARIWLAYALLTAAALYTHGAALVAVPCQLLATAVALPKKWRFVVSGILGAALYVPFLYFFPRLEDIEFHVAWAPSATWVAVLRFPALLLFGRHLAFTPAIVQAVAAALIVGLVLLALWHGDRASFLGLQWLFAWAAAAAAGGFGIGIIHVERYFAPALVCQVLLIAISVHRLADKRRPIAGAAAGALAALALLSTGLYFVLPPSTPWREMAALIEERRISGEAVVVASPRVLATPFAHYYDGQATFLPGGTVLPEGSVFRPESVVGIWLCLREFDDEAVSLAVPADLRARFPHVTRFVMPRGAVLHLTPVQRAP